MRAESIVRTSFSARRPLQTFGAMFVIAALLGLLVFMWQPISRPPGPGYQVATAVGEHRSIKLADGSIVALNGNSRLWIAGAGREAELLRGEALFSIRHNSERPFILRLGENRIEDLGTAFNIVRDPQTLRVEVAEGAVRFSRGGNGVQINAGQALQISSSGDAIVSHKNPSSIASWRNSQLVYEGIPVAEVAADLGRNLGVGIAVSPRLAYQPFTGSIHVGRQAQQAVPAFASTLSARARKSGNGWLIE